MDTKQLAGRYAADLGESGWVLGLGTGSTVAFALERLAERVREGLDVRGVPTSLDTESKCRRYGIPLTTLEEHPRLRMTIDGADEVDPQKRLIKGGGGALLREKVVASASEELVVIVGENKVVDRLGVGFLLPVEVVPFAVPYVLRRLEELGCAPFVRAHQDGKPLVSDNGNRIVDCRFDGIDEPEELERRLNAVPGIVENGLFCGLAGRVVVGKADGGIEVR
ncbi:MAG: ribose-5-phosphate isomerase RpiA [Planctomycetota bacterium]